MYKGDVRLLKEKIEFIKYGILKVTGPGLFKVPSCLIESFQVDDEGGIWCSVSESVSELMLSGKSFPVQLKYVHKEEGLFLKVQGKATVVQHIKVINETRRHNQGYVQQTNRMILRVHIEEAEFFKKQVMSRYTSFFQSVYNYSYKQVSRLGLSISQPFSREQQPSRA
jgi:general stress protein 26